MGETGEEWGILVNGMGRLDERDSTSLERSKEE